MCVSSVDNNQPKHWTQYKNVIFDENPMCNTTVLLYYLAVPTELFQIIMLLHYSIFSRLYQRNTSLLEIPNSGLKGRRCNGDQVIS